MLQKLTKGEKQITHRIWISKRCHYPKRGWWVKLLNIKVGKYKIVISGLPTKRKPSLPTRIQALKLELKRLWRQL